MTHEIYVVEDEENIRELICVTLQSANFKVSTFENSDELFRALENRLPSLILLDIMLPRESGYEIIKRLKRVDEFRHLPIIFLTAKSAEVDKVQGLNLGADDFIVKPFGVLELIARVSAVIRRCVVEPVQEIKVNYKDLMISLNEKAIYKNYERIPLTFKEYELFLYFHRNKGIVLSREKLLEQVWGFNFDGETRTVDAHIRSLRNKLNDNSLEPQYIKTVRGHGYMMIR